MIYEYEYTGSISEWERSVLERALDGVEFDSEEGAWKACYELAGTEIDSTRRIFQTVTLGATT